MNRQDLIYTIINSGNKKIVLIDENNIFDVSTKDNLIEFIEQNYGQSIGVNDKHLRVMSGASEGKPNPTINKKDLLNYIKNNRGDLEKFINYMKKQYNL